MIKPTDVKNNLNLYMHPLQIMARNMFLKMAEKHGNGLWAFEELEWKIYIDLIDEYEALNEEDKYALDSYMRAFRSLYK
jgi:hypothetical protein